MPKLDRTGPIGQGALTGRGLGNCKTENTENKEKAANTQPKFGLGLGFGKRFGRGCGRGFNCGYGRGIGFGRQK